MLGNIIRRGEAGYRQCSVTVMDTTDPGIRFNQEGISHWVTEVFERVRREWNPEGDRGKFNSVVQQIKAAGKGKKYDCILGLSGGLDSSYLALLAFRAGLRPLVVHTDTGWNSELAVSNIEKVVNHCSYHLVTHVIDWGEMADIQRAFIRAGVPNQDIPQDHGIFAALYSYAAKNNIRWVLNGSNYATESVLPAGWGYDAKDSYHLKAIHRLYGERRLRTFPTMGHIRFGINFKLLHGMQVAKLLNLVPYSRQKAIEELSSSTGWRYYGAKHYESRWTRYFQGYWLPTRFGYDKRLAHLSSLILSGQMSRSEALEELTQNHYPEAVRLEDEEFIVRKLNMKSEEYKTLFRGPLHSHLEYPNSQKLTNALVRAKRILTGKKQKK